MQKTFTLALFSILFFLFTFNVSAQTRYAISGTIKDAATGEAIIGALIKVKELPATGTTTNAYGFYSLSLSTGNYTLIISSLGLKNYEQAIVLNQNLKIDAELTANFTETNEVIIEAQKSNDNITRNQMGVQKLDVQSIKAIPVLFGERDILKTIQLLPGIKSAGEGNTGFYVRGGSADQNLILLDEATVYNASHLLGFFSVFNSDAIKDVSIYKGGMPAEYGGRLSSVLDIKMRDGNAKKLGVSGGIGLISSRLNIEAPIVKNKGSFLLSGRRTYGDLFLKLSKDTAIKKSQLYFYDFNAKANYTINQNNKLYLSGYFGRDVLGLRGFFGIDWGNATGTLRYNHIFNAKLFSNTSLIYTNYDYQISIGSGNESIKIISRIQDYNIKQDFQYFANDRTKVKFGLQGIYHIINPGQSMVPEASPFNTITLTKRYGAEYAPYTQVDYTLNSKFSLMYGIRFNTFNSIGPGTYRTYNEDGTVADTFATKRGQIVKTYFSVEPRAALSYLINETASIKANYARNSQNIHTLSNSTASSPTDLLVMSSNNVKPETSDQVSLGYFKNFAKDKFEFSVETYYKWLGNQIDYKNFADTRGNELVEGGLLYGIGRTYGVELFLKKRIGKFNGWVGYTLSRSERQINGINDGSWYAAKQDRTHDVSVVLIQQLGKKWTISGTFIFYTGGAVTYPTGKYTINGQVVNYYSERNGYRLPNTHRADIGATWQAKKTEKFESSWNFSVYNLYNRQNPFQIDFRTSTSDPNKSVAIQTALFKLIPSVSWDFKF